MDSTKGTENRIQIGNDIFPLQNCISTGPTAPLSDYFLGQRFKFEMSFSLDHLSKSWAEFSQNANVQIDFDTSVDLKFYCDQLETGNISLASGNKEIKRILSYNPSSKLPTNWRSAKAKVESYVFCCKSNFIYICILVTLHIFIFFY